MRFSIFLIINCSINSTLSILLYCDVMLSISTQARVHFWMYLLNGKSLAHEPWLNNRFINSFFRKSFAWIGGLGINTKPFLIYEPVKWIENQIWVPGFLLISRSTLRHRKHHLLKINRSHQVFKETIERYKFQGIILKKSASGCWKLPLAMF